jgi:trans-2,3-dihydro-3-hydroxyanthranilate isomerase
MLHIARELNLSETTFVFPPADPAHTFRLRIFTPGGEVPFAGHPTVGSAFVLAAIGRIPLTGDETRILFEEGVGPVPVSIFARQGEPVSSRLTTARLPELGPTPPAIPALAAILSLTEADLLNGVHRPEAWSVGLPFLFVPVRNQAALAQVKINAAAYEAVMSDYPAVGIFVFTPAPEAAGEGVTAQGRMWAPMLGGLEDPATGSACAAMAGYWAARTPRRDAQCEWLIVQGVEMGRPSRIQVAAEIAEGRLSRVTVQGASVLVGQGMFYLSGVSAR